MGDIVLVPGGSSEFVFAKPQVKLVPRSGSGREAPVKAGPDTGWPPPKVLSSLVNRAALKQARSYNSWADLLNAVEGDSTGHLATDGQLYARVASAETFDLDRAIKVLRGPGDRRLIVEYEGAAHGKPRRPGNVRRRQ